MRVSALQDPLDSREPSRLIRVSVKPLRRLDGLIGGCMGADTNAMGSRVNAHVETSAGTNDGASVAGVNHGVGHRLDPARLDGRVEPAVPVMLLDCIPIDRLADALSKRGLPTHPPVEITDNVRIGRADV